MQPGQLSDFRKGKDFFYSDLFDHAIWDTSDGWSNAVFCVFCEIQDFMGNTTVEGMLKKLPGIKCSSDLNRNKKPL
ncbi:hypothetical protein O0S10_04655 [Methanocorpusculum sp. MG]|uniref:Uncharacterized protein n=1 Tax=Methanocorpusculum petauri TaxID=3002863 RepID=A0ABT4IFL5_9EURY|nr:hypothetical protein [Methanocorpusculum petauri]MCZ0860522.1 hypothetical protein [Methanocorpusculum petauri]MDE2443281.1 hypothetical protein [Methanocorpusculum sp.]